MWNIEIILGTLVLLSLCAGMLGPFVIWHRLAYFSDSLSHVSLFGIALAVVFNCDYFYTVLLVAAVLSFLFVHTRLRCSDDTVLSMLSSSLIAIAMVVLPFDHGMESVFLGNLYAVGFKDLMMTVLVFIMIILGISWRWQDWLMIIANQEMAYVAGINVERGRIEFLMLLSLFIAIAVKLVGFFFVGSLLVIPSITSTVIAFSPLSMVIVSSLLAVTSTFLGILFSWHLDLPVGPSIILCSVVILILCYFASKSKKNGFRTRFLN